MRTAIRTSLTWLMLVALTWTAAAGANFSELRGIINDETRSTSERLAALEAFAEELNASNAEEFTLLTGPFFDLDLADDQLAVVVEMKARGMISSGEPKAARATIDDFLERHEVGKLADLSRFRLFYQKGRSQWRIKDQENRYTKALFNFQQALDIAEDLEDISLQIKAHDALGYVLMKLKDTQAAVEHYAFIMRFSDDEEQLAQARYNISFAYDDDPLMRDTALVYMLEARETFERYGDQTKVAKATVSIASNLREAGLLDEAAKEYQAALSMGLAASQQIACYEYLGLIASLQKRHAEARQHLEMALVLDRDNRKLREVYISTKLGKVLVDLGETERGLAQCKDMLVMVQDDESLSDYSRATRLTDCLDCIGYAQLQLEEYKPAFASYKLRDSARKSYETIESNKESLLSMELFHYEDLREKEKRRVMDKQRDDQRTLLVVIVLLLIVFAIFITSRYRFTRKQSQLISTQRQQLQDRQRELIRANAELEIALNHKAVFLSNMSHEIRTPLNAIVGMSNLASKEEMTQGAQKYLRNIVTASSNLIDIVNDILDFSKLEAGKLEIAQEPFSVGDALEVAENVMRIPAEQKGLQFDVDADENLPGYLLGDASRLNQVLINLIGNAIKFTLEGGVTMQAKVSPLPELPTWCTPPVKDHAEWFVVRVTDTGIGIPADKLEKIFESFNQGDQLKTRKFGGTGLGLSISKQIVELQGGVIWVESVEGEGSTFAFALPALASDVVEDASEVVTDNGEIGPLRVLIAEDNPFNVIVTEDTLRSELKDITIGKAENGRIAFEKVRDEEWDLVLMDVHMPEMSGLEATAAIRKLGNTKSDTLIIAMTASVLKEETDSYIRHGMNGFVPKPFQVEQLISEIRRLRSSRKPQNSKPKIPALRILIAEDNPFNVIVAEDTLRSEIEGVTIGKAVNGKEAFEAVRDGEWDLVLMDIAMPEMTGLEATAAIRKLADPSKAQTTIIAMTASVLKEETDHYIQKGMNGFVPKPFKLEQLLGEIERAHLSRSK